MKILSENIISKIRVLKEGKPFFEIIYTYQWKKYKVYKEIIEKEEISKKIEKNNSTEKTKILKKKIFLLWIFLFIIIWIWIYLNYSKIYSFILEYKKQEIKNDIKIQPQIEDSINENINQIVISEKLKLELKNYYLQKQIKYVIFDESKIKTYTSYKELIKENYGEYFSLYISSDLTDTKDTKSRTIYVYIPFNWYTLDFSKLNWNIEEINTIQEDLKQYKKIQLLWGDVIKITEVIKDNLEQEVNVIWIFDWLISTTKETLTLSDSLFNLWDWFILVSQIENKLLKKKSKLDIQVVKNILLFKELVIRQFVKENKVN